MSLQEALGAPQTRASQQPAIGAELDAAAFAEARRRLQRPLQVDLLAGLGVTS